MRLFILSLLTLIFPLFNFAQDATLKGKVVDADDRSPLTGAKVVLDGVTGTLTDYDGFFTLKTSPGKHILVVTYMGYEDYEKEITLEAGLSKQLNVNMVVVGKTLKTVVISASQYEKDLAEETVSMDVIDKTLIRNNNATDLGEAVDKSVGVQVQDGQVTIRGGSSYSYGVGSRTAVLVDNLSYASADLGEAQLKTAPLENVEQIEVIKGAASVIYGSSALNGVVNVITSWPGAVPKSEASIYYNVLDNPSRPELDWRKGVGKPFSTGASFQHARKIGNFDLIAGGNFNSVSSYLQSADEIRYRYNFKLRHRNPKHEGMTYGINFNQMYENSGRFFIPVDLDTNAWIPADYSTDRYLRTNIDPHFTYVNEKGTKHRVLMRYMNVFRKGSGETRDASSNNFSLEYQFQRRFWKDRIIVTAGIPLNMGVSISNLYEGRRISSSGAGYLQGELKIKRLSWVAGVRYEYNSVDTIFETTIPVFRTGINYHVGKATFFRASWGQAYRLPTVGERFIQEEFANLNIFPNPALKAEKGWGLEVGIKQGIQLKNWMGYADFAVFWNEYDNFVEYRLGSFIPDSVPFSINALLDYLGLKPVNLDKSRVAGFEFSFFSKGKIGQVELRTLLGYTYNYPGNLQGDSTQRNVGVFLKNAWNGIWHRIDEPIPTSNELLSQFLLTGNFPNNSQVMNYRVRHLFKADIEAIYKNASLGFTALYGSLPEHIDPLFFIAVPGLNTYAENHLKGDLVLGLRAGYKFREFAKLSFIIKNLTNHEYATRPARLDAPRNYTLQLNLYF